MKCVIPEISWHNRDPVLSADIQPLLNNSYRLATGGGDCHVLVSGIEWNSVTGRLSGGFCVDLVVESVGERWY